MLSPHTLCRKAIGPPLQTRLVLMRYWDLASTRMAWEAAPNLLCNRVRVVSVSAAVVVRIGCISSWCPSECYLPGWLCAPSHSSSSGFRLRELGTSFRRCDPCPISNALPVFKEHADRSIAQGDRAAWLARYKCALHQEHSLHGRPCGRQCRPCRRGGEWFG